MSKNSNHLDGGSGDADEGLLPFPSLASKPVLSQQANSINKPTTSKPNTYRRSRADTLPPSFNFSFNYTPSSVLKNSTSSSDLRAASASEIPVPKSIPAISRAGGTSRLRGATFSVPNSSPFTGQGLPFSPNFYNRNNASSSHKQTLSSLEETENAIARSLGYLGLDDPEPVRTEPTRHQVPEAKGIAALKNSGRNRSRSFNVAVNYLNEPQLPPPPVINAPVNPPRLTVRQARARAISVGFLNQEELFDTYPEIDGLGDSDPEDTPYSKQNHNQGFGDNDEHSSDSQVAPPPPPSRSLWVGNLDSAITTTELHALFSPYGPIESLRVLPEKECAFVNFMSIDDAVHAKEDMQEGARSGLNIRIGFGKATDPAGGSALNNMTSPNSAFSPHDAIVNQPTRALWIGNISASTSSAILASIFSNFGTVESARVLVHKNCGFVNFATSEEAQKARNTLNGKEISGSVVRIGFAKVPPRTEAPQKPSRPIVPIPLDSLGITVDQSEGEDEKSTDNKGANDKAVEKRASESSFKPSRSAQANPYGVFENGKVVSIDERLVAHPYMSTIPSLPPNSSDKRLDPNTLRSSRKVLESRPSRDDFNNIYNQLIDRAVDLCTDYIGNTLIQKLAELGSDEQKLQLIRKVTPHMPAIGCHKNGTWAIQKILDCASTEEQIDLIVAALKNYTPPLLLDQFGNYVIQCCLKFGPVKNQFIFDAIHARFWDVVHGRFGTRAIRTCLDSKFTTKDQQRLVAIALVNHGLFLATDTNGSILLTWLLDSSTIAGRFSALVPQFSVHLPVLCTHKLASLTILKIINQRVEPDARESLIRSLFFGNDPRVLESVVKDQAFGLGLVQKILASSCISDATKEQIADTVREVMTKLELNQVHGYRNLVEELNPDQHGNMLGLGAGRIERGDRLARNFGSNTYDSMSRY